MQRRKFIAGMGSLAAAGGAAIGTGAFTSVQADRTVSVEVAGDASAYLAIEPMQDSGSDTSNAAAYVDDTGDAVAITLDGTDNSNSGNLGSGINANAETKFANLLQITNQGTQEVYVGAKDDPGPIVASDGTKVDGGVFLEELQDLDNNGNTQSNAGFAMPDSPIAMKPGDTVDTIGLDINDPSTIPNGDDDTTITIIALTDSAYSSDYDTNNFPAPSYD